MIGSQRFPGEIQGVHVSSTYRRLGSGELILWISVCYLVVVISRILWPFYKSEFSLQWQSHSVAGEES